MRRRQTSVLILASTVLILSGLYLVLPSDPVSRSLRQLFFGLDNQFASDEFRETENIAAQNQLSELLAENQRLKEQLNFENLDKFKTLSAHVVAKSVQNYRSTIDLDVGAINGVKIGQSVLASGQLIGRVIQVDDNRARVLTLADPDFRAAAIIEGSTLEGLVRHVPGGSVIEQVPGEVDQKLAGARVVTSGLGDLFPPGLYLGTLGEDISAENAIFREYVLDSTQSISAIQEVVILQ